MLTLPPSLLAFPVTGRNRRLRMRLRLVGLRRFLTHQRLLLIIVRRRFLIRLRHRLRIGLRRLFCLRRLAWRTHGAWGLTRRRPSNGGPRAGLAVGFRKPRLADAVLDSHPFAMARERAGRSRAAPPP